MTRLLAALTLVPMVAWGQTTMEGYDVSGAPAITITGTTFVVAPTVDYTLTNCTPLPEVSASPALQPGEAVIVTDGAARKCRVVK